MKVIWCLFDDGVSSYKSTVEKYFKDFKVYSIGINEKTFNSDIYIYTKCNLSLTNYTLINELDKLDKPDIILASPPCESWSNADCAGKIWKGFDSEKHWIIRNKKYYDEYNLTAHKNKKRYFLNKETNRINGESTVGATVKIIEHYKPKYWVIENPTSSKLWDFLKEHWNFQGIDNKTFYSSYDRHFSLKPTNFLCNINLQLKQDRVKGSSDRLRNVGYDERSAIPELLIKDILNKLKE